MLTPDTGEAVRGNIRGNIRRASPAPLDLTESDRAALAGLLRETIERDRFPLLAKLDPTAVGAAAPAPYPPARAWVNSSIGRQKRPGDGCRRREL